MAGASSGGTREHMSAHRAVPMKKRRARELVPEEREDTCRSHRADTAAGGAGVEWGTRRDSLWGEVGWGSIRNYRGTCYRVGEGVFSSRFSITVCRFLRLRGRGCVYAETCVYARGYVYAPAVYTHYRSRKRTYPRIRTRVRVRTRCVNAPSARVYTPTRVYAPGCVYAPAAYTHPPLA